MAAPIRAVISDPMMSTRMPTPPTTSQKNNAMRNRGSICYTLGFNRFGIVLASGRQAAIHKGLHLDIKMASVHPLDALRPCVHTRDQAARDALVFRQAMKKPRGLRR